MGSLSASGPGVAIMTSDQATVRHRIEAEAVLAMRQQISFRPHCGRPMMRATARLKWLLSLLKQSLSDTDLLVKYMEQAEDFPP
jgi:hypothetical protein